MFKSKKRVVIECEDWQVLSAALVTFSLEPFLSSALQHEVKKLLVKYR